MRRLLAAASEWRTLIWLGAGLVAGIALSNPFPALIGLGLYVWAVQRLASSPEFEEAAERVQTARKLADQYKAVQEALRSIHPQPPQAWQARITSVLTAARSIYHEYLARPKEHAEKTEMVSEALKLTQLYLRVVRAYHLLYAGKGAQDLRAVVERLQRNQERLNVITDLEARRTLMRAIEMDQRVLEQNGDQDAAKERYLAKLAAIESTMDMMRRQIFDPMATGDGERLHEMLLEAEAMDEALEEVQRHARVRAR